MAEMYRIIRFDADSDLEEWLNNNAIEWEPVDISDTNHSICCLVRRREVQGGHIQVPKT